MNDVTAREAVPKRVCAGGNKKIAFEFDTDMKEPICLMPHWCGKECATNSDCSTREFCNYMPESYADYPPKKGTYDSFPAQVKKTLSTGVTFYYAHIKGVYLSGDNYCQAIGKRMATLADIGCDDIRPTAYDKPEICSSAELNEIVKMNLIGGAWLGDKTSWSVYRATNNKTIELTAINNGTGAYGVLCR